MTTSTIQGRLDEEMEGTGAPFDRGFCADESLLVDRAFETDDEYWMLLAARFLVRHRLRETRKELPYARAKTWGTRASAAKPDGIRAMARSLEQACQYLERLHGRYTSALRTREQATPPDEKAPIMLRVIREAGLSHDEADVLHYLVLAACDSEFANVRGHLRDIEDISSFLGLDAEQMFGFFEDDRPLRQHELISLESRLDWVPAADIKIEMPLVKALRGLPLKANDRFGLNSSLVESVLGDLGGLGGSAANEDEPDFAGDAGESPAEPEADLDDDPFDDRVDLDELLRTAAEADAPPATDAPPITDEEAEITPYTSDVEYLDDHLALFKALHAWKTIRYGTSYSISDDQRRPETRIREAQGLERVARRRIAGRIALTVEKGGWEPRAERLARTRGLNEVEKHVLLLLAGVTSSFEFRKVLEFHGSMELGELLVFFCDSFADQVAGRRHFYRTAPLVRDGLVNLGDAPFARDLLRTDVELDRRVADFLLGLDTEGNAIIEGTKLFTPTVDLDRVILPEAEKELVVRTVEHFPRFQAERRRSGLDEILPYGQGIVLLFHGPSGTGKTMLANALATHMKKPLLLVNYPQIGQMSSDQSLRFLFREARLHEAILFFDECDGVFEDRQSNAEMSLILTELERHDGLIILATNRPFRLDEGMQRRITLAVPFHPPDAIQRQEIWRAHVPPNLRTAGDCDFSELAYRYELTGGFIKNAVMAAVNIATSRDDENPVVRPEDFDAGARLQLRTRMGCDSHDHVKPRAGLTELVVPAALRRSLDELVGLEKARRTLIGQWGFGELLGRGTGTTALFHGLPGTGKTLAAEAVGFELGRPVRRVNAGQLVSKWVGETGKNLESVFREARQNEAVLLFDEADALFAGRTAVSSATDRYANLDVAVLLRELESFPGVAILTSNLLENLDPAFKRRLRFILEFSAPDEAARTILWRNHLPPEAPLAPEVDVESLAASYALTGAQIRNAVIKGAAAAALRSGGDRAITQADLSEAAEAEALAGDAPRAVGFQRSA